MGKTDLGNSICASHELSKVEQKLAEIWDIWIINLNVFLFLKRNDNIFLVEI